MKRRSLFLMGLAGVAGCSRSNVPRLNVFNWSSYVAPDTISNFERESGAQVRYSVYESNEEMLARVMTGNSGWDVVFPTNYIIEPMRQMGLLAPLDHGRLSNLPNLDPLFARPGWDPNITWSVPYMWNATGIACSTKLQPAITGWKDLWESRLSGRLTMLDDPVDVFAACLKKLGCSANSSLPEELERAQVEAVRQKPLVRAYVNAEVRDQLISGDVLAAQLWSTTAQQAMDASTTLRFVYPAEGYPLYPDCAVILAESGRPELAHLLINYLLRPQVAADIVVAVRTATANGTAKALLPSQIRDLPTLYPPREILARAEWAQPSSSAVQKLRDRLWTEVKSS